MKNNRQYILYDEGKCSPICDLGTHYIINEYDENLCISRESLSDEIEYTPLAIILGSFCTLVTIIMITVVSLGQKKRNNSTKLIQ